MKTIRQWQTICGILPVVCWVGLTAILVGCAAPKVPWRVVECVGEPSAQVRIASQIREPDLTAQCVSEWKSGFLQVSVRFDGAFHDQIVVESTWFDKDHKVIPQQNNFERVFSLGADATRTESWRIRSDATRALVPTTGLCGSSIPSWTDGQDTSSRLIRRA